VIQPAAKQGDHVTALDTHLIQPPGSPPPPPVPVPHKFDGLLDTGLSTSVFISGRPAATVTSVATNTPPHLPQGGVFVVPPTNKGRVITGSLTVSINGKPAARNGDTVMTCNDPVEAPVGKVVAAGTVWIGG
jgi:uncharacterized Zn-binding protein involved in type VI secretion